MRSPFFFPPLASVYNFWGYGIIWYGIINKNQKLNIVSDGKLIYLKFINTIWSSSIVLMNLLE
jgi:hypothetical protein